MYGANMAIQSAKKMKKFHGPTCHPSLSLSLSRARAWATDIGGGAWPAGGGGGGEESSGSEWRGVSRRALLQLPTNGDKRASTDHEERRMRGGRGVRLACGGAGGGASRFPQIQPSPSSNLLWPSARSSGRGG